MEIQKIIVSIVLYSIAFKIFIEIARCNDISRWLFTFLLISSDINVNYLCVCVTHIDGNDRMKDMDVNISSGFMYQKVKTCHEVMFTQ